MKSEYWFILAVLILLASWIWPAIHSVNQMNPWPKIAQTIRTAGQK